ncbi:peptidylprolyl isomerase [Bacillus coahuilensis]|uniref:peptidylprolyl isomerase n=1 Tax=Bacillus coahuilensis TaxID=408580 RepID=UPI000493D9FC|nr:peptidylprolyl isomerase [Bacillus coahuilensis]
MYKRTVSLGIVSLLLLSGCNNQEVIVEAENTLITEEDLYNQLLNNYRPQVEQALRDLTLLHILEQNYDVSSEELQLELENAKEALGSQYEEYLNEYQINEEQFKEQLALQVLQRKAAISTLEATEKDLQDFYTTWTPAINVRHILVSDKETAKKVLDELQSGTAFEDLAETYSIDSLTASSGGNLGTISYLERDAFSTEMLQAMDELQVNEISQPIESPYGFHIVEITEKERKKTTR